MSVLIVAEQNDGQLDDVVAELVSAAAGVSSPLRVLVISSDPEVLASQAGFEGIDEILTVRCPSSTYENDAYVDAISGIARQLEPSVILAPHTTSSAGYGAAVAARCGMGFASDVYDVRQQNGEVVAKRGCYGNKIEAEIDFPGCSCVLLTLRSGVWNPAPVGEVAQISEHSIDYSPSRARHVKFVEQPQSDVDITQSPFLVSIGRGIGDQENVELFEALADQMGATLSSSRPLVDSGWMPKERQVGQSGKTVSPKVYLAFGISGAVQHLAGMKGSDLVVAVNTDSDAPIFGVADYGVKADAVELAEALADIW